MVKAADGRIVWSEEHPSYDRFAANMIFAGTASGLRIFGWLTTVANFRKTRFKGLERDATRSYLAGAAYNLMRMARLLAAAPA